ncbi:TIGR01244 family phosphatase [Pseudohalioglobus sediminis]|uniref:TIGR01244 family phosphatase n=1 Tax=Pseudohalioglobus sediminis TaxID=2606449 RepID=A0A5B0X458_9GAMM|nr:TIGR01244 family sulfur transferase [Pseudohalioglobus sediminis]KAA1194114.1 TIGR01244 family phosphatase [Pseudohalioglobus sediminis]
MNAYKLSESLAVCGQITPGAVADIAAAGYKVLINNRPDGEENGQPTSAEIAAAAEEAGLEYHYMPVTAMNFPGDHLQQMADLFDDEERPAFAFCRTGTRCTNLWVLSRESAEREQAAQLASKIGFDLSMAARAMS